MPQNLDFIAGHRVGEVAHDYVPALKQWLTSEGIKNSYDSWHGTYFKITIMNTLLFLMTLYDLLLSQKLLQYRIFPLCLIQHFVFMQRWKRCKEGHQKSVKWSPKGCREIMVF